MSWMLLVAALAAEESQDRFVQVVDLKGDLMEISSEGAKAQESAAYPAPEGQPLVAVRLADGSLRLEHGPRHKHDTSEREQPE